MAIMFFMKSRVRMDDSVLSETGPQEIGDSITEIILFLPQIQTLLPAALVGPK